jgi:hypothetical protein
VLRLSILLIISLAVSAGAQVPVLPAEAAKIAPSFDAPAPNSLKCFIEQFRPTLDFALRFQAGYMVRCQLRVFEGRKVTVLTYLRVTPVGKTPVYLSATYNLPGLTPEILATTEIKNLKQEIGMSGAFSLGEGDYFVEVLVTDDRNRSCYKHWKMRVAADHSRRRVHLAVEPFTVQSFDRSSWDIHPVEKGAGIRLTVLLDAAPINPYQSRLRAWDRAFLLESVYSLLRQMPYKSVRLVAFNLDQQREIYRRDAFDGAAFLPLSHALREMETATVSVQALKSRNSPLFLSTLANQELAATDPSDAIIFLGPNTRIDTDIGADWMPAKKPGSPPFFYFQYFPWPENTFPDSLQHLMKAVDGKTFQIHSPAELDQAIQKMLRQLKEQ